MSATCAQTIELKLVSLNGKAVSRGHLFLQPFDVIVLKLHDLST